MSSKLTPQQKERLDESLAPILKSLLRSESAPTLLPLAVAPSTVSLPAALEILREHPSTYEYLLDGRQRDVSLLHQKLALGVAPDSPQLQAVAERLHATGPNCDPLALADLHLFSEQLRQQSQLEPKHRQMLLALREVYLGLTPLRHDQTTNRLQRSEGLPLELHKLPGSITRGTLINPAFAEISCFLA